jgi:hypothetical protein
MGLMTILFIVWGVFLVGLLSLLAYNATLTRYEEDQLFLNDSNNMEKQHQSEILTKLSRTQPLVRVFGSGSVVLTLALVGMFAWDAIQRLR